MLVLRYYLRYKNIYVSGKPKKLPEDCQNGRKGKAKKQKRKRKERNALIDTIKVLS